MTAEKVKAILGALHSGGRWVSRYAGELLPGQAKFAHREAYFKSGIFAENTEYPSRYLELVGDN